MKPFDSFDLCLLKFFSGTTDFRLHSKVIFKLTKYQIFLSQCTQEVILIIFNNFPVVDFDVIKFVSIPVFTAILPSFYYFCKGSEQQT